MTEEENLALNVSSYCNGDLAKSMPVTREEWNAMVEWEKSTEDIEVGDVTYWMHVDD